MSTDERAKAIREHLGGNLSQEAFGKLCGLTRLEVQAIESGKNRATSYAARAALARGIHVPIEALAAYLDGEIEIDALWSLRGADRMAGWWREALRLRAEAPPKSQARPSVRPDPFAPDDEPPSRRPEDESGEVPRGKRHRIG